jgi:hypothetical protein
MTRISASEGMKDREPRRGVAIFTPGSGVVSAGPAQRYRGRRVAKVDPNRSKQPDLPSHSPKPCFAGYTASLQGDDKLPLSSDLGRALMYHVNGAFMPVADRDVRAAAVSGVRTGRRRVGLRTVLMSPDFPNIGNRLIPPVLAFLTLKRGKEGSDVQRATKT